MDKFVTSIKKKYRDRLLHREEQWPPVRGDRLINLQLVEADKTEGFRGCSFGSNLKRTPILYADLFKVEDGKRLVRKVIAEGNAGMGKTTLCTMLAEKWAREEILQQFKCVLLLPLRERLVSTAATLQELFKLFHSSERIRSSVIEELEDTEGDGVLIIADGWDELNDDARCKNSFLYDLFFGNVILPLVSILLASRPSASVSFHGLPLVDRFVEVMGFNGENIIEYIQSDFAAFPDKADSLMKQLDSNPFIQGLCTVPLNCAIVCNLWYTLDQVFSSTYTEVYTRIVLNVILHNIKIKLPNYQNLCSLPSFDSIPKDLEEKFWLTCKFAYECISRNQIVFSEEDLNSFSPEVLDNLSDNFLCFGLLQSAQSLLPNGYGLSFHFIHLTIQEYLAALHLATLPTEEKMKVFIYHAQNMRFDKVGVCVFGLASKYRVKCSRKIIDLEYDVVNLVISSLNFDYNRLFLCHCAHESKDDIISTKIANKLQGQFENSGTIATGPDDFVAIFHVLRYTSRCSNVTMYMCGCDLGDKQLKELADILQGTMSALQLKRLYLNENKLTSAGVCDLFEQAPASFSCLEWLSLKNNNVVDIMPSFMRTSCTSLTMLSLSNNPLGVSGILSLETAIQAGVLVNLELLHLSETLTDDSDINGALLTVLLLSIATYCPFVCALNLSNNVLSTPGAYALGESVSKIINCITHTGSLELHLDETFLDSEAIAAFCSRLFGPTSLTPNVQHSIELFLNSNPLKCESLSSICELLREHCIKVTHLHLDSTCIAYTGLKCQQWFNAQSLGPTIEACKLSNVFVSHNDFSGEEVFFLAELLRVIPSLTYLVSIDCSLSCRDLINLLTILCSSGCTSLRLREWDLDSNSINDEGVSALLDSMPELFSSLECVHLLNNPASKKVKDNLKEILEVRNLSHKEIENKSGEKSIQPVVSGISNVDTMPVAKPMEIPLNVWTKLMEDLIYYYLDLSDHEINEQKNFSRSISNESDVTVSTSISYIEDKSIHSATTKLALDESVGSFPTASDESTTPKVRRSLEMSHQETQESIVSTSDSATNDNILTQSFPLTFSGMCRIKTVTIEELKIGTNVTDSQLDLQIQEQDFFKLSAYFDNVESYLVHLGLTPSQRTDIEDLCTKRGTQIAMSKALRLWREPNPFSATFRALVTILIDLGKGDVAVEVCRFLSSTCNH